MIAGLTGLSGLSGLVARGDVADRTPGLAARFRADDLIGVIADAAKVTSWPDATGNGNDLAHGTAGNQPPFDEVNPQFNGHASVNFSKASSHYLFTSTGPLMALLSGSDVDFTILVAIRRSAKVGNDEETVWALGNSGSATQRYCFGTYYDFSNDRQELNLRVRDDAGTTESRVRGTVEIIDLGPQVLCWSLSGAAAREFIAGASQNPHYDAHVSVVASGGDYSAQGAITFDRFAIGALLRSSATLPGDFEVAEICVYSRELADAERVRVSDYLHNRYCATPVTSTFPAKLLDGLTNLWDTRSIVGAAGATALTLPASVGSIGAFDAASGGVAPTIRLDPATGDKYLEFDGVDNLMTCGAASDWRFLHDGSDFTIAVVYRVPSTASAITPIIDTLANDVANVGFGLYHDAASGAHSFQAKIGNDTEAVINHDSQDYGSRPDAWHIAMISRESGAQSTEEQYQVYLDNENYAAFDQSPTGEPIAATNPAGTLTIGGLAGGGTFGRIDIKAIAIWDRKLSRPDETMLVNQIFAKQLATSHVALVAGNGLANILNQTEYLHRGFPGLVKTSQGHWLCTYRRASAHGSSTGVCCAVTSGDGIVWSQERVIIDDSANFDWRGVNFLGEFSGRLFLGGRWATVSTSGLIPYTTHIWYSDDGGGSWAGPVYLSKSTDAWFQGLFNGELDHDEGLNSIVQLGDGSLLAHFCALVDGGVFRHLVQCRSYDLGETWTEPEVVYYGRATGSGGDFPADEHLQEPVCLRFADGELLLAIRSEDTNHRIYFARSTDDGETWTPSTFATEYQAVWGNPRMAIDPNDPDAVYMWIRNGSAGLLTNWIYSDDRGATWSALRRFANLTSTTTIQGYTQFDYAFPAVDEDGNVWVAYALNRGGDCDTFVQRWSNAE